MSRVDRPEARGTGTPNWIFLGESCKGVESESEQKWKEHKAPNLTPFTNQCPMGISLVWTKYLYGTTKQDEKLKKKKHLVKHFFFIIGRPQYWHFQCNTPCYWLGSWLFSALEGRPEKAISSPTCLSSCIPASGFQAELLNRTEEVLTSAFLEAGFSNFVTSLVLWFMLLSLCQTWLLTWAHSLSFFTLACRYSGGTLSAVSENNPTGALLKGKRKKLCCGSSALHKKSGSAISIISHRLFKI